MDVKITMTGKKRKKILVINPFGVGDVLFTTPVVRALKQNFPDSFIGYLCHSSVEPLLKSNPNIDALFFFSRGDFKNIKKKSWRSAFIHLWQAMRELRRQRFDAVIDLSLVSQYSVLLWMVGVKQRWGFNYRNRGRFLTQSIPIEGFSGKHVVEYYGDLLRMIGLEAFETKTKLFVSEEDRRWAAEFLRTHDIKESDRVVGITAFGGASWGENAKSKQWPIERFAEIGRKIMEQKENTYLVLLGTKKEEVAIKELERLISGKAVINVAGKTTLGQLAALIDTLALLIGNDSGPLHMACALGTKSVAIFGPVDEKVYGSVGDTKRHITVSSDIACRPCYQNFRTGQCYAPNACLEKISVETVWNAVERLL